MKKNILIAIAIVVALIVLAATVFVGKLDGLIADAIQTEGTAALGTTVKVQSVETNLTDGSAVINGLSIANPVGYKATEALTIGSFTANVDYETQVIENIDINQAVINAELTGTDSNFQALLDGMPESEDIVDDANADEEELQLSIKSLQLRETTVNVDSDQLGQTSFVMEDLHLKDLNGTVGELSDEITNSLINHVTSQIKGFATAEIGRALKAKAEEKIREAVDEKLKEKLNDKVDDKLKDKLGDKLKGFKFKSG